MRKVFQRIVLTVLGIAIGSLPVAALANHHVEVVNTASASFSLGIPNEAMVETLSNTVQATVTVPPPTVTWFRDPQFTKQAVAAKYGQSVYLQAEASACNFDPTVVDSVTITVTSARSGDLESYVAWQTEPNSALYRVPEPIIPTLALAASVQGDAALVADGEDNLEAWVVGCKDSGTAMDALLIDPRGVVFDSVTNEVVAGATVTLIDVTGAGNGGHPGSPAVVFDFDGETSAPSTVVTGADGVFSFPLVASSTYRLDIRPPGDYVYPSTVPQAQLPSTRVINELGSFAGAFPVNEDTGLVLVDVPLDSPPTGLYVEKRAGRQRADIGESLAYTVTMGNVSGLDLTKLTLTDTLPPGFTYVSGSAKLDDVRVADPSGGKGPTLVFAIDSLRDSQTRTLTYRVSIGPGALEGDATNRAILRSASPARKHSNVASSKIDVQGGVFDDRAYVLGKVFADCNANGVQDSGEHGVPRVRIYMEDGSFVITDGEGKYSFYGVTPRTHVLKVDSTTLPDNVQLAAISHRNAGTGDSRFIDVKKSELHRADFATAGCSPSLAAEIAMRQDAVGLGRELDLGVKSELKTTDTYAALGDVRALPAAGIIGETTRARPTAATSGSATPPQTVDLQTLVTKVDAKLGFIGLQDGDSVCVNQATVRVKGLAHTNIQLKVNDVEIGGERVGMRAVDELRRVQALEFVGVALQPGDNELLLTQRDQFGNLRELSTIHLVAAGQFAKVVVKTSDEGVPADGDHYAKIDVELQDAAGVPVAARTAVTLEATLGEWLVQDLDPNEPNVQVFIEGGQAQFALRSPLQTGTAKVRASSSADNSSTADVSFVAALRPLLGVGVLEGTFNINKFDPKRMVAARHEDGFERELTQWSGGDAERNGGARAALFLKGKVRGDYLLTLGYDSDKDKNERLFRDIQPDQFYPVYGDSSVKGYDAQSTGKLYVRVDRNKSYFLGGDITTQSLSQARILGAYSRSLTGVKEHFEVERATVDVFASYDSTTQVIDELPANGTSGPFFMTNPNALENSELIEIVTRDRDQPSIIINSVAQQRFSDYEIEPLTGRILLRAPVPSVDENLNPISIRITYEVDQGGDEFWTAGVDSQFKITDTLEIGGAYVDDRNPMDARSIASVNSTVKLGQATTLIGEVARTEQMLTDAGRGERIEVRHEGEKMQLRAFGVRTDETFDNPSAGLSPNRSEAGAKAGYSMTDTTRIVGEMLHSADVATDAARDGAFVGVEQGLGNNIKAELGARHVIDDPATSAQTTTTSVRTKVSTPLPGAPRATLFGEYEQDVAESDSKVVAGGGTYQLANRSKLYARHEFISSLAGPYALDPTQKHNTTVFGVDTSYWKDDHFFSEYRIGDALSGREAQAAIGLRNGWQVARGVRLHTTFERIDALRGSADGETSAVTGAIEYTRNPLWKGTARLELNDASTSQGLLSTLGLAYKLSDDWTFLGKNVFALMDNDGAQPDRTQDRFQVGIAYRDSATNRVNGLGRYEFKHEENVEAGMKRDVHIFSAHADLQATRRLSWRAQYATKFVTEDVDGLVIDNAAHLLGTRATYDIAQRWDVGVHARALFNRKFDGYQGGVGAEVGFLVTDNLWVSAGYNVIGFRDDDLAANEYTTRGAYLRLRFKFDEGMLQ